jgi:hypothetical protein
MADYSKFYQTSSAESKGGRLEQLLQLLRITADGDLISKPDRNKLVELGLSDEMSGFNIITPLGIKYLHDLGLIHP